MAEVFLEHSEAVLFAVVFWKFEQVMKRVKNIFSFRWTIKLRKERQVMRPFTRKDTDQGQFCKNSVPFPRRA